MDIYDEETFGPVTTIVRVEGVQHALQVANDTAYGLATAIISRNVTRALDLASRLNAGCAHQRCGRCRMSLRLHTEA